MTAPAFLTPARLLLGKEELLANVFMCLPIQDVKDCVPLGKQLHLIKRGLLWCTVPAPVGCSLAPGTHSPLEPQASICWGSVSCTQ